jgi:hypothetical protein
MRASIIFLMLVAVPIAASAQPNTVTVTTACTNPGPPAEVSPPATPSIAAGTAAARNREFALARANFSPLAEQGNTDAQRAMGQLLMQEKRLLPETSWPRSNLPGHICGDWV